MKKHLKTTVKTTFFLKKKTIVTLDDYSMNLIKGGINGTTNTTENPTTGETLGTAQTSIGNTCA
ncbi:hypothetical protein IM793_14975 [Pedobacter sp. MR2016-19]|uniref:hypothetical protein n=1 Tax=Pedobacter sp. MR2016-19 TaxID=2780089 RepID=UPI0018771CD5|nr:hypothetical protein [Pedobacter sp. MR2016-19]MBE5320467.1 hypothetical protein [Pedobacter sp. MR2016-19]